MYHFLLDMAEGTIYLLSERKSSMKMAVLWVVAPCSLVEIYQRFRGPCCLHHQGDGGSKDL
jgi:hypothetical protein